MDLDDEITELDLSHISHGCAARMKDLAEIQWRDFINQDPLNHLVLILSCDVFVKYISSRTVYFYLKYYELFYYSKSRRSPIKALKTLHITAPWRHSKYPLLWYNGLVMLSRQVGYDNVPKADVDHTISSQGTAVSTSGHLATTPRAIIMHGAKSDHI